MTKYVDNGTGVKLNQSANCQSVDAALATCIPVKASAGPVFGFSTSAKMLALQSLVTSMRTALINAGIAV